MTKEEAIVAMVRDGAEVKPVGANTVWKYVDGVFRRNDSCSYISNMNYPGYEIYTKPKEKVKMWQWIVSRDGLPPFLTSTFYSFGSEVLEAQTSANSADKALWTEIEL